VGIGLTVLDAYAVVAAIAGEEAGIDVERLLRSKTDRSCISGANLAEVVDRLVRVHGFGLDEVWERLDLLRAAKVSIVPVDEAIGRRAGELRAIHYHRERSAVSLADCLALASAEIVSEPLATPDPALAAMARAEGVEVVALPNSQGRRP
jgi:PIN domain nuclease of toxin-antitoxin system